MTATPAKSCAILLGASEYPLYPALNVESARSSAMALKDYFLSSKGISVSQEDFLNLFGSSLNNTDQLLQISRHIERFSSKCEAEKVRQNIFFIYIGHGIPYSKSICLAIASTSKGQPYITSLKVSDLADEIKKLAAWSRRFVILDCCYAGAGSGEFLSADGGLEATATRAFESHRQQQFRPNPIRGTTVLCAADKESQARAPKKQRFTAFSGILIEILLNGKVDGPSFLSLRDIWNIACARISTLEDVPMPVLLSPDQTEGDLADLYLFPNYAIPVGDGQSYLRGMGSLYSKKRKRIKIAILAAISSAIVLFVGVKIIGSGGDNTSPAVNSPPTNEAGPASDGVVSAQADTPVANLGSASAAGAVTNEAAQTAPSTAQTAANNAQAKAEADQAAAALAASKAAADKAAADQAAAAQAAARAAAEKAAADQAAAAQAASQAAAAKLKAEQEEAEYQRKLNDYAKCHNEADQAACARVGTWEPRT